MSARSNDSTNPSARQRSDHLPLHRLWSFARVIGHLDSRGQAHVQDCPECSHAFQLCLGAENFGAVLKELNQKHDDSVVLATDGRPKLKTLFVVPGLIDPQKK